MTYQFGTLAVVGLLASAVIAGDAVGGEMPRVRVSDDGKAFALAGSGERFVPWGFNYLGKFEHLAEEDWDTPAGWKRVEADFREMRTWYRRWLIVARQTLARDDVPQLRQACEEVERSLEDLEYRGVLNPV